MLGGIKVQSVNSHNGDGIIIDSSKDILVEYNHLSTGDDAVVIKSGFNEEGLYRNIPTENLVVRNYYAYDVRTGSGGVVFGSETSGGIRNVYVHDALFENCDRGIRFKTSRGRGNVTEHIYINNIELMNCRIEALNFNTFYDTVAVGPSPSVKDIQIRNVKIDTTPKAVEMIGLPEQWIQNITLENITIKNAEKGILLNRIKNLRMNNIDIYSDKNALVFNDVFEAKLDSISLNKGSEFKLSGIYSGMIQSPPSLRKNVDIIQPLNDNVFVDEIPENTW